MRILGAVLAGGRASRFGSDKALAVLDGKTLLDRVIAVLARQTEAQVICGRTDPCLPCLPDRPAAGLGPLGGLNAALHHARDAGYDAVVSVPCDTPILPDDLVRSLRGAGTASYVATVPVIGLWPASCAEVLDRLLAGNGSRSMRRWAASISAMPVEMDIPVNVNTEVDLVELTSQLRD